MGRGRVRAAAVALLMALLAGWLAGGAGAGRAAAAAPPAAFEWGACPAEVPPELAARVRCGVLVVPENRASNSGRTIRLPVAKVPSRSATPQPDPVVFPTSGGPGGGSLSALWYFLDWAEWANAERDVLVVEQRGDRLASPTLNCPEAELAARIVAGHLPDTEAAAPPGRRGSAPATTG